MKRISYQNIFIAMGSIICMLAFIWGVNTDDRVLPSNIFFIGAGFAMTGMFLNILLLKFPKPLKLFAVGAVVVCIGILFESTSIQILQTLKVIGICIAVIAVAWHAYEIMRSE